MPCVPEAFALSIFYDKLSQRGLLYFKVNFFFLEATPVLVACGGGSVVLAFFCCQDCCCGLRLCW